ncbi:exported hypothetical protein [Bradyrhizobium sp. ORS 375]|nr:exported hypothetical protein [Bradyrhizobium sp. ORS 375]
MVETLTLEMSLSASILCSMALPPAVAQGYTQCMPETRLARIESNIDGFCRNRTEMVFEDGQPSCYLDERMVALTHRILDFDQASSRDYVRDVGEPTTALDAGGDTELAGTGAGEQQMTYWKAIREPGSARLHLVAR